MNKYLLAALYVVAGCVATIPIGIRGGSVPVGTDSYRLLVSSTEKVITISTEKKSVDDLAYGLFTSPYFEISVDVIEVCFSSALVERPGWKVPEVTANPIRAPGEIYDFKFTILN